MIARELGLRVERDSAESRRGEPLFDEDVLTADY
jgi:hypothetical protein